VTVFEKHADFLRDFRGDTVHPSTLRVFDELGLLDELLKRDHVKVRQIGARVFGRMVRAADFSHLPVRAPFIALMPQWDLLDFIAQSARRYPGFELRQSCAVTDVVERAGRIAGVRLADGSVLEARLVIAADGRDSRLRQAVGATTQVVGAPMDVFWFRLPKLGAAEETMGVFEAGTIAVMIDRGSYWQCAWVFAKGTAEAIRARGIDDFRAKVLAIGPQTAGAAEALNSWEDVKLLTVTVDRLSKWSRPGLLVIGDAAHAMSPIGGVGINLAVQDAVATANILAGPMAAGEDPDPLLGKVQARRMFPTRATQAAQWAMQQRVIAPLLSGRSARTSPPLIARVLNAVPLLQRIPARLVGMGVRSEHVRSPDAFSR
jgi:2-polyprenyl-6-methoxyphenol hydroxylase-like FAD-dependent oxidoreductase